MVQVKSNMKQRGKKGTQPLFGFIHHYITMCLYNVLYMILPAHIILNSYIEVYVQIHNQVWTAALFIFFWWLQMVPLTDSYVYCFCWLFSMWPQVLPLTSKVLILLSD